jgi:chaperonin GroES
MALTKETKTKTTLKPLGNRVLAKRLEQEKTQGGIILPDSAKKKQETAEVIAVGSGTPNKDGKILPMPVQVGDKILMDKYSGQEVSLNDEEFIVVKAEDIVAIIQ